MLEPNASAMGGCLSCGGMKLVSFLKEAYGDQSSPINGHLRQNPRVPRVGGVRTVYCRGYRPNKKA
eukprot:7034976-Prymnesium_polylepis.1